MFIVAETFLIYSEPMTCAHLNQKGRQFKLHYTTDTVMGKVS